MRLPEIGLWPGMPGGAAEFTVQACAKYGKPRTLYFPEDTVAPRDPADRDAFDAHWAKIRSSHVVRTVLADGDVVGSAAVLRRAGRTRGDVLGRPRVLGEGHRHGSPAGAGHGGAERPLYARAASDNAGSLRVLEKCGFRAVTTASGYANARGAEIEETVLILEG